MKSATLRTLSYVGISLSLLLLCACKPHEMNEENDVTPPSGVLNETTYHCETLVDEQRFDEAFSDCLEEATAGSGLAQYLVGQSYLLGRGVQKDEVVAVNWLLKAAKTNVYAAQNLLGDCYLNGQGVEQNISRAVQWYTFSATQGSPLASYSLGKLYLDGNGVNKNAYLAEQYLKQAAEQNVMLAQVEMAKLYHEGHFVPRDDSAALKWYQRAAAQGEPQSLYVVGLSLIQGTFAQQQNIEAGAKYLQLAASKDYYPAQYALASLFLEGYPVLKDNHVAIEYLRKAALGGSQDAQVKLATLLMDFAIPEYDKVAFYWALEAAKSQRQEAQYLLGKCYLDGIGTEVDYDGAFQIFTRLAIQDYPLAQLKLGQMYYNGQGNEKDLNLAKKWILKAASRGDKEAKHWVLMLFREGFNEDESAQNSENLSEMNQWIQYAAATGEPEGLYLKGISTLYGRNNFEQHIENGMQLLEKAALNESVLAQRELGMIYEQGLFNLGNLEKAHEWYLKASQNGDDVAQFQLANMFYTGNGVAKSYIESYAWANLASLSGKEEATTLKNEISHMLAAEDLAKARDMADKYFAIYKKGGVARQEISAAR